MSEPLRAAIAREREALVRLAAGLIRLPTVNPPGEHYGTCAALLARSCRAAGLTTCVVRVPQREVRKHLADAAGRPRLIVLARWDVGAERTVHLNAHYDVVPAAPTGWRFGPFTPRVHRGALYGRGAADMKGAIAAMLHAVRCMRDQGTVLAVNVELSFTPDEETDSRFGAAWLVRQRLVRADYVIVGEGGSGRYIGIGHNGVLWFEVEVHGRAAHGSQPHRGVNAFEQASGLVLELRKLQRRLTRRRFRSPDGRVRCATINVGGVVASGPGSKINTVPASVAFTIDRRVLPNENLRVAEKEIRDFIRAVAARQPGLRVTVRKLNEHKSTFLDPRTPFARAFGTALARVRRHPARYFVTPGFNDSHFFAGEGGLPTIGWGPGGENCHGTDERVSVRELVLAAQAYAEFLTTFRG